LESAGRSSPLPQRIHFVLLAAGSWWIPLLFILGFWRHVYRRFPLRYDPQYWGMIFPLGMYTVCTFQLSKAINFTPLLVIPKYFVYLALAGWILTFAGLIYSLFPARRKPSSA
jgi:tellurite resistance protein TehA-like permease